MSTVHQGQRAQAAQSERKKDHLLGKPVNPEERGRNKTAPQVLHLLHRCASTRIRARTAYSNLACSCIGQLPCTKSAFVGRLCMMSCCTTQRDGRPRLTRTAKSTSKCVPNRAKRHSPSLNGKESRHNWRRIIIRFTVRERQANPNEAWSEEASKLPGCDCARHSASRHHHDTRRVSRSVHGPVSLAHHAHQMLCENTTRNPNEGW